MPLALTGQARSHSAGSWAVASAGRADFAVPVASADSAASWPDSASADSRGSADRNSSVDRARGSSFRMPFVNHPFLILAKLSVL